MSETRTVAELASIVDAEYKAIRPSMDALDAKLFEVHRAIKTFIIAYKWHHHECKFNWVKSHSYLHAVPSNITENGIYFDGEGYDDPDFLSFEEMDNIEETLVREFAAFTAEQKANDAIWKARKRAELEAQLAKLND